MRSLPDAVVLDIEGMTCASCVHTVERALDGVEGVRSASVNLVTRTAAVEAPADRTDELIDAVRRTGYLARPHREDASPSDEVAFYRRRLRVAAPLTIAILVVTFLVPDIPGAMWWAWALATPVQWWAGWPFLASAGRAARHGTTTMDTLIAIGSTSAYVYSAWAVVEAAAHGVHGDVAHYFDTGAVIITLILLGKMLEARARAGAGDASRALLERAATEAIVLGDDGSERSTPIDEVIPGMRVVVRPGGKIPADGVVGEGTSWVDLSLLTGESVPVDVGPGDDVVAASINGHGRLVVFVTKVGAQTRLAEIVRALQAAQGSKAPVQRLADRVSAVFVPVVLAIAAATFVGWIVIADATPGVAMVHAVAVLIIACPCALGLATPAAIMAGTGRAAGLGILFKDATVFEAARGADVVLLDKTGTVTEGRMELAEVRPASGADADELLTLAAAAERGSEHPIAAAVVEGAATRRLELPAATDHGVEPGAGATAVVGGSQIRVGRPDGLAMDLAADAERLSAAGLTTFAVHRDGECLGLIAVSDRIRDAAEPTVSQLHEMGFEIALVTGDRRLTAEAIGERVGLDTVLAEVVPERKAEEVKRLQSEGHVVVFVGDGINDAPALATADVGVAMGTGTDVALAAADVNLLAGTIGSVVDALALARRTFRIIKQNLFWAFAYNVVMIPLAVFGVLDPMWAAGAMALSSLTVVLNALRLRRFTPASLVPAIERDPAPGGVGVAA